MQSMVAELGIKTAKQAFRDDCIKLCFVRKYYNYRTVIELIKAWIINLNDFVGVSNKMAEYQVVELAEMLYEECYILNFAEFALMFRNVKKLKYGQFYSSVDPSKVMLYVSAYLDERKAAIDAIRKEEEKLIKLGYQQKILALTSSDVGKTTGKAQSVKQITQKLVP